MEKKKKRKIAYGTSVNVTFEVREKLARLAKHFKRTRRGQIEILVEEAYKLIFN